jgi:aspartate carbamoyltransferase catalytic subunit
MEQMPKVKHVLTTKEFDRPFLDYLCNLTNRIREMHRTPEGALKLRSLWPHKRLMLYFTQPSSRTFLSFLAAGQNLGMDCAEIRDPRTSSEVKGESFFDAIRTFSSYVDIIAMRTPERNLAEQAAAHLDQTPRPVPIINAGSGPDQHPTQALLDVYTILRSFKEIGGIDGKTIAMVGDLKRGRTVRSLSYLMKNFHDVNLIFVSPEQFKMEDDILDFLRRHHIPYSETDQLKDAVAQADAVYLTRIQDEHDQMVGASAQVDYQPFYFTPAHLALLKPRGIVMHPLPRRQELDPACDSDPRVKIWRQERNGMWVRTALLHMILKNTEEISL